ncbi:unnamed protein product [Rotaria sp. Silwood1]|nr:unnamed protein product [Rotaria sp. Silwood1]
MSSIDSIIFDLSNDNAQNIRVLGLADINIQLQNISQDQEQKQLIDIFPIFYSIVIHFDKVSITGRSQAVEILLKLISREMIEVQRQIHIGLSIDDRRFHLNIIKMLSYLVTEYIIRFDNDQTNKSSDFDMPPPKV